MLRIRQLPEDHYQPATANRMLGLAPRRPPPVLASGPDLHGRVPGRAAVQAVLGESEPRGRDLCGGELRGLLETCAHQQDSAPRRRRDAAFLALAYGCGPRRAEVLALDLDDLDLDAGPKSAAARAESWPRPCCGRVRRTLSGGGSR